MGGFAQTLTTLGIEVVGQAKTLDEAAALYAALLPDVLVLDVRFRLEKQTGLDMARELLQAHPDAKIVFLSQFDQEGLIKESYQLGGKAFLTKDCEVEELADAVKQAHRGSVYLMPAVAERLAKLSIQGDRSPHAILHIREISIFRFMAQGLTNHEIAEKLSLSTKTISNSSQSIKDKLGVSRQADLTRLAVRYGILDA